jgi:hypothetical protein
MGLATTAHVLGGQDGDVSLSTACTDLFSIPTPSRSRRWEAIDLIHDVPSATDLVPAIVAEAEAALDRASTRR